MHSLPSSSPFSSSSFFSSSVDQPSSVCDVDIIFVVIIGLFVYAKRMLNYYCSRSYYRAHGDRLWFLEWWFQCCVWLAGARAGESLTERALVSHGTECKLCSSQAQEPLDLC
jgi:hypothetical protein